MAMSLGIVSSFVRGELLLFVNSSATSNFRLAPAAFLRANRAVTMSAAGKPATETKKSEPRGIMKPRRVSPEMQAFLGGGVTEISRTQALKEIWAYIKQFNLQDPADKKIIVCDEKLKKIFAGRERVGFLEVAGLLNPHFLK